MSWRDEAISVIMDNRKFPYMSKSKERKARAEFLELISALSDIELLRYYGMSKYDVGYDEGYYNCNESYE